MLNRGKDEEAIWFDEELLDFVPEHVVRLLTDTVARDLGLCHLCDLDCHCHVLVEIKDRPRVYKKLCPILFKDVFKASWELDEIT